MADRSNPVVKRYLENFEGKLAEVTEPDRREMVSELESHIAEATHGGQDLAAVIEQLGPADRLADAYRIELALQEGPQKSRRWRRHLMFLGIVATTSLPSFIIVSVLGALGLGFTLSGILAMLAGPLNLILPENTLQLSTPFPSPLAEMSVVLVGLVLVMLGVAALVLLYGYGRFLYRAMRHLVGRVRTAEA